MINLQEICKKIIFDSLEVGDEIERVKRKTNDGTRRFIHSKDAEGNINVKYTKEGKYGGILPWVIEDFMAQNFHGTKEPTEAFFKVKCPIE